VGIEHLLDLNSDLGSLLQNLAQAVGQAGQDRLGGAGAGDDDGLFGERGHDPVDQAVAHARGVFGRDRLQFAAAGFA
jgi:hypothetical protein